MRTSGDLAAKSTFPVSWILAAIFALILPLQTRGLASRYWHDVHVLEALASEGVQVDAVVDADQGYKSRKAFPEHSFELLHYRLTTPDGVEAEGKLVPWDGSESLADKAYPLSKMNPKPKVGDRFTVTALRGANAVFRPGIVTATDIAVANRRLWGVAAFLIAYECLVAGALISYHRLGFVSRLLRTMTISPESPDVLFVRSMSDGRRTFGFAALLLMTFITGSAVSGMAPPKSELVIVVLVVPLFMAFAMATIGFAQRWARIDRNLREITTVKSVFRAKPTDTRSLCSYDTITIFRETYRERYRGGVQRIYIAAVALESEAGKLIVFETSQPKKGADALAREVATAVSRFVGIPIVDRIPDPDPLPEAWGTKEFEP